MDGIPSLLALPPMLSERHADAVVVWAPAKVNLYLEVLAKRPDGYHEIATLMMAVSLYDTLEFKEEATGKIQLDCDHPELTTGPENLVCRAVLLTDENVGGNSVHVRVPDIPDLVNHTVTLRVYVIGANGTTACTSMILSLATLNESSTSSFTGLPLTA